MFIDEKKFGEFQVVDNRPFDDINRIIEWLEKQPPAKKYRYIDQINCLGTKYLESCGLDDIRLSYMYIYNYKNLHMVASGFGCWEYDITPLGETYGKALERAKQIRG